MSRSNPSDNGTPNPATRWFEWNGGKGTVRYYDKAAKQNVDCGAEFAFILLDELGSVRGWHEASESGIYSNEVRDTRQDVMVVKAFKGGTLAEGLYKDIKDRVNVLGGHFNANCYLAFRGDDGLEIGCLRFKGAALGAWMDFCKENRSSLYKKTIQIVGATKGKKGSVTFYVPTFQLADISRDDNDMAVGLDTHLQAFLKSYLRRNTVDRAESTATHTADEYAADEAEREYEEVPVGD